MIRINRISFSSMAFTLFLLVVISMIGCSEKIVDDRSGGNVALTVEFAKPGLLQSIDALELTVTGGDFDPITVSEPWSGLSVNFAVDVPAGIGRVFQLRAFSGRYQQGLQPLYEGAATANIGAETVTPITISMLPVAPIIKLSPVLTTIESGAQFRVDLEAYNLTNLKIANILMFHDYRHATVDSVHRGSTLTEADSMFAFWGEVRDMVNLDFRIPFPTPTDSFLDLNGYSHLATIFYTSNYLADSVDQNSLISMGDSYVEVDLGYVPVYFHEASLALHPSANMVASFPDLVLEEFVRSSTNVPAGNDLMLSDVLTITYFWAADDALSIATLEGIEQMTNATDLWLNYHTFTDLTPLTKLPRLVSLNLNSNNLKSANLAPLAQMTDLQTIYLSYNGPELIDISPLEHLTELRYIRLIGNGIVDITPLVNNAGLGNGDYVYLGSNPLSRASIDTLVPILTKRGVTVFLQ